MPAPATINIRYGDNGILGQAAAQSGYDSGLLALQQHQSAIRQSNMESDIALVNDQNARRQQADEFAQQQQNQANQLQQAAAFQQQQLAQQQPTSGTVTNTNPGQNVRVMKNIALNNILGDSPMDPDQKAQLQGLVNDDTVPLAQVENLARGVVANSSSSAEKKAKQAFVDAATPNLLPDDQASIKALAAAPQVSPEQLRMAVDQAKLRATKASTPPPSSTPASRQQLALQVHGIDEQTRSLQSHIAASEKALQQFGYDPNGDPSQFQDDQGAAATQKELIAAKQQLQALLKKRDDLVSSASNGSGSDSTDDSESAASLSNADLLKALGQ